MQVTSSVQRALATRFARATIRPSNQAAVSKVADRIVKSRAVYEEVAKKVGLVPWWVVGIIHGLECNFSFSQHLHNGDPLSSYTKNVPRGRPVGVGKPPFPWEVSAVDALRYDQFDLVKNWSLGPALDSLEKYNGLGYRKRGIVSPYLWSFTSEYMKGKFVRDGVFDANAVSAQVGAAAALKELEKRGVVSF